MIIRLNYNLMTINNSAETIEELIKGKVWIDEIDQRCLFESDVKKTGKRIRLLHVSPRHRSGEGGDW